MRAEKTPAGPTTLPSLRRMKKQPTFQTRLFGCSTGSSSGVIGGPPGVVGPPSDERGRRESTLRAPPRVAELLVPHRRPPLGGEVEHVPQRFERPHVPRVLPGFAVRVEEL